MAVSSKEFNFNRIFGFPFRGEKAFEKLVIGWLVNLLNFFIPLLPAILAVGYQYRIMSRDINGDGALEMPEWDDLWGMFKDGFRLWSVNLIYSLPAILLALVVLVINLIPVIVIIIGAIQENEEVLMVGSTSIFFLPMISVLISLVTWVIQMVLSFLMYPALGQVVAEGKFAGGFHFKAWWSVLKRNFLGYLIVVGASLALSFVFGTIMQVLVMTIVGIIAIPMGSFIMQCYSYALIAEAYVAGRVKPVEEPSEALPSTAS
jgi:hypothetical protein